MRERSREGSLGSAARLVGLLPGLTVCCWWLDRALDTYWNSDSPCCIMYEERSDEYLAALFGPSCMSH
jgi:hypothetical protein